VRRTTIVFAAALVTIAGTAGFRLIRSTGDSSPKPSVTAQPAATVAPTTRPGTPPPTTRRIETTNDARETPTRAALRFLNLDEQLFPATSPEKARALTESIASASERSRLGDLAEDQQRQILAKGDLAGVRLRIAPIVARTGQCDDTACTVDVYFLRLWSFPGKGALDDYATAEIVIVFEKNEWRLQESSVIDGPYPAGRFSARPVSAMTAGAFETTLEGFTDTEVNA
jgi:hypothetical protein